MSSHLDPVPRSSLERGTALSAILSSAEQQRLAAEAVRRATEDHALTVHQFVRAIADGDEPDPAPVLRSRGRVEAMVSELLDEHAGEGDAFGELRVALVDQPDANLVLEERAMAHLRARLSKVRVATDAEASVASPSPKSTYAF